MLDFYYDILQFLGNIQRFFLYREHEIGENFHLFFGGGILAPTNKIKIGNNVSLHGWLISDGGSIEIGDDTVIHKGTVIRAMNNIKIGTHCDIGGECYIQDHNSMSTNYKDRRNLSGEIRNAPVIVGDDVWIGRRSTILKGVTIGDKCIIGTCTVVTNSAQALSVVAGNPGKVVKTLDKS